MRPSEDVTRSQLCRGKAVPAVMSSACDTLTATGTGRVMENVLRPISCARRSAPIRMPPGRSPKIPTPVLPTEPRSSSASGTQARIASRAVKLCRSAGAPPARSLRTNLVMRQRWLNFSGIKNTEPASFRRHVKECARHSNRKSRQCDGPGQLIDALAQSIPPRFLARKAPRFEGTYRSRLLISDSLPRR